MTPSPAESPRPRHDLGVLLVHGVGAQRRGETLADFGRPILEWLEWWCDGLRDRWVGAGIATSTLRTMLVQLEAQQPSGENDRDTLTWAAEALHELIDDVQRLRPDVQVDLAARAQSLDITTRFAAGVLAAGVELVDARRETPSDPEAPAHAQLVLRRLGTDGSIATESWLVAESWWAETFRSPRFSDLARWGLGIVPWTLGSHFGAAVRRAWAQQRGLDARDRIRPLARFAASVLRLLASLPLALLALLAFAFLLLAAALPIPRLRTALGALQRWIAASLGDSYVLVTRPIEAASIVGQVRRDLEWLDQAVGGGELAIVAHSQGAAVTHEALRHSYPNRLRLLLTFGSGLRKLEELRKLLGRAGHLRRAAGLTLTGLVVGALYVWAAVRSPPWAEAGSGNARAVVDASFGWLMSGVIAIAALAVLFAGLRDMVQGMDLTELRRRVRRLAAAGVRWVDVHATKDPVPNGALLDPPERVRGDGGEPLEVPISVELCNESSSSNDHTAYWRNRDEFVSLVIAELTGATKDRQPLLAPKPASPPAEVASRRRSRVKWLRGVRGLGLLGVVAAVLCRSAAWGALLAWVAQRVGGWWRDIAGATEQTAHAALAMATLRSTLGTLLLAVLPALAARAAWRRWDADEMRAAVGGGSSRRISGALTLAVAVQVASAACIALLFQGMPWLPPAIAVAGLVLLAWLVIGSLRVRAWASVTPTPDASRADRAFAATAGWVTVAVMAIVICVWIAEAWVERRWMKLGAVSLLAAAALAIAVVGGMRRPRG